MNLSQIASLRPEEAAVVENAIRLAIDSVVNVLYGVNSGRDREYRRMLADRDKEIAGLRRQVHALRRRGCASCAMLDWGTRYPSPDRGDPEMDAGTQQQQQQCELTFSLGVFDGSPSHVASPAGPPEADGVAVKEEPCNVDAVLVKWELSQESPRERAAASPWDAETELREVLTCDEADGPAHVAEAEQLRSKKKRVPTAELPEEAQQQKRAAWRAASRRYYARKVARRQAGPPPRPLPAGGRRASLLPASPRHSPQREAWRASSRSHYARKAAQQHNGAPRYGRPEPPGGGRRGGTGGCHFV